MQLLTATIHVDADRPLASPALGVLGEQRCEISGKGAGPVLVLQGREHGTSAQGAAIEKDR